MTMCRPNTARRLARSLSSCTAMVQAFYSVTAVLPTLQLPKKKYVALVSNLFNCISNCLVLTIALLTVLFSQLSVDEKANQLHLSDHCIDLFQYILVLRTPMQVSRHSSCAPHITCLPSAEGHQCSSSYCIQRYLPVLHTRQLRICVCTCKLTVQITILPFCGTTFAITQGLPRRQSTGPEA